MGGSDVTPESAADLSYGMFRTGSAETGRYLGERPGHGVPVTTTIPDFPDPFGCENQVP